MNSRVISLLLQMLVTLGLCWQQLLMMAAWFQFSLLLTWSLIYLVSSLSYPLFLTPWVFPIVMQVFFSHVTEESKRITESNGRICSCHDEPGVYRVWMPNGNTLEGPGLAISRAFGDYYIKDFGLISEPELTQRRITDTDQFAILATDGVCAALFVSLLSIMWKVATSLEEENFS